MADGTDRDGVVYHHRRLIHSADAYDCDLRLIDDRRTYQAAEAAEIGDGERSAHHFIGLQLARTGTRGQIDYGTLQAEYVLLIRGANHGHNQAVLQRNGDADVDLVMVDDVVIVERCVEQ